MAGADSIILGDGAFAVGGVTVALTRGGGSFVVEREYRTIEADGDQGLVIGRIRKINSVAKLTMNALELLTSNLDEFYPGLQVVATSSVLTTVSATTTGIAITDYSSEVTWTGATKAGKQVKITLTDAINLENINWSLIDKEEVVPELTFTACYKSSTRTTEPWKIEFAV